MRDKFFLSNFIIGLKGLLTDGLIGLFIDGLLTGLIIDGL